MKQENHIHDLLRDSARCSCGRAHYLPIEHLEVGSGALGKIPGIVSGWASGHLCVVSDARTEVAVAGDIKEMLRECDIPFRSHMFGRDHLMADESSLGELMLSLPGDLSGIVCVGSGTLSDICRFAAWRLGVPCCLVPTAPSMDGYASAGSSIFVDGIKKFFVVGPPVAIVADSKVLATAPKKLVASGFGEIMAKQVSVPDWQLAQMMGLDADCASVRSLIALAIDNAMNARDALQGDPECLDLLMEGLLATGATVSFMDSTRAVAGSEHEIGHFLEMMDRRRNGHATFTHGQAVALGTLVCLELFALVPRYLEILGDDPREGFVPNDQGHWEKELQRVYGMNARVISRLEKHSGENTDSAVLARRAKLIEKREEILSLIASLPDADEMRRAFDAWGLETDPARLGISAQEMSDAILYGKEFRDRFGLLQILFDLGRAREAAEAVTAGYVVR